MESVGATCGDLVKIGPSASPSSVTHSRLVVVGKALMPS